VAPLSSENSEERSAKNSLYGELLGAGLFYSIDYDRTFGDFAGRVGLSYLSLKATGYEPDSNGNLRETSASASFLSIPLTVSYLGIGSKKHMFELGAGATILHMGAGASSFYASSKASATVAVVTGVVGYRLQPPDGGFMFRVGLSPIYHPDFGVLPWPHISFGASF
jgi:hypothetical protein